MKKVTDKKKLLEITELTLNEGTSELVVEYIDGDINIMEVTKDDRQGIVWATTCEFESIEWVLEVLKDNDVDFIYWN